MVRDVEGVGEHGRCAPTPSDENSAADPTLPSAPALALTTMDTAHLASGVTLQQLAYFLSAVNSGSLSAAAEEHFISQPSLSDQIRRLERHLGVTLFIRTNRSLILTDAARTLIPHAERTLRSVRAGIDSIAPVRDLTGGTVRFGTFSSGPDMFVADLVEEFQRRHPQVSLQVVSTNSVQIAEEVRAGRVECAVVALPVNDRGLEIQPISWSPETTYFSADEERTRSPMTMERLGTARLVLPEMLWGDTDPTRLRLLLNAQRAGQTIVPYIEVESAASALELTARGVADTVLTYTMAHALKLEDVLHSTPLEPRISENFGIIRRRNSDLSPGAEVLVELTVQLLNELPERKPPP
jgi:LysR family transcriptional regulator, cyn operon transcriptional activator